MAIEVENVEIIVRKFIVENFLFGIGSNDLSNDSSFLELGIVDSTGVLELIAFIEERFAIEVADEELVPENLDSVNRVALYVNRKTASE